MEMFVGRVQLGYSVDVTNKLGGAKQHSREYERLGN